MIQYIIQLDPTTYEEAEQVLGNYNKLIDKYVGIKKAILEQSKNDQDLLQLYEERNEIPLTEIARMIVRRASVPGIFTMVC